MHTFFGQNAPADGTRLKTWNEWIVINAGDMVLVPHKRAYDYGIVLSTNLNIQNTNIGKYFSNTKDVMLVLLSNGMMELYDDNDYIEKIA